MILKEPRFIYLVYTLRIYNVNKKKLKDYVNIDLITFDDLE